MSSAQSLQSRLKALDCHFTWDLDPSRGKLFRIRDKLEDIGTDEGNFWLGHIYNLLGFVQYQLGSSKDALDLFDRAAETFQRQRNSAEGPWLMVNFGNRAWLHHHLGEDERSEDFLSKVDGLMRKKKGERHPEVLAEKAWTLMKFDKEKKQQAAELFQRAIRMQPDTVEWQSSYAILSTQNLEESIKKLFAGNLETLRSAKEQDPENLCIAALYLEAKAASIKREARELAERILERPMNNYCGIDPLLTLYVKHISVDEAVEIAKEALRRHPDSRFVKRSAAKSYTKKIQRSNPDPRRIREAISLWEEVVAAYPESSLEETLTLASLHAKLDKERAEQIYKELLEREDLDPAGKQMLYNYYAKHLYFQQNNSRASIKYHMMAAEIQEESKYRHASITELKKTWTRVTSRRNVVADLCQRIQEFLARLGIQPETQNVQM